MACVQKHVIHSIIIVFFLSILGFILGFIKFELFYLPQWFKYFGVFLIFGILIDVFHYPKDIFLLGWIRPDKWLKRNIWDYENFKKEKKEAVNKLDYKNAKPYKLILKMLPVFHTIEVLIVIWGIVILSYFIFRFQTIYLVLLLVSFFDHFYLDYKDRKEQKILGEFSILYTYLTKIKLYK